MDGTHSAMHGKPPIPGSASAENSRPSVWLQRPFVANSIATPAAANPIAAVTVTMEP